jgi:signal transduction histidine kinase
VRRLAEADQSVLAGACSSGELVDRTLVAVESGEDRRVSLGQLVPETRNAFGVDELVLVAGSARGGAGQSEVLAADPPSLLKLSGVEATRELAKDAGDFITEGSRDSALTPVASIVSRCRRDGPGGITVGLLGARKLDPLLAHIGTTMGVSVRRGSGAQSTEAVAQAECAVDGSVASAATPKQVGRVPLVVSQDTSSLHASIEAVDRTILAYCSAAVAAALVFAMVLARGLSRPLSNLADEARKVARDEARPVRVRGSGEIADLTSAFDRMLDDLAATRRRLAATTRVAAWREVARRVAHEVKNPLAPIRAAVETLRRLRARDDPAFDDYFDEATRTVLNEVKRIADIVTEFTRFARLPPPKPRPLDLVAVAREVVQLHEPEAGEIALRVEAPHPVPEVMADRDQIVQVLTNLVQNALDAMRESEKRPATIRVVLEPLGVVGAVADRVAMSVCDDGPGVAPEMIARLFEPYATSKEHGTGLGLAIAQRIAVEHGGELSFVARPRGAEFRMVLPTCGPPPVSEMPPASG